jgi:hypothetical protein
MKILRSISAVLLATLVLFSSTSFMVGMHICMGQVKSVALFGRAESCQKENALPICHQVIRLACCEDETVIHEGSDFKDSAQHIHHAVNSFVGIEPVALVSEIIPISPFAQLKFYNYDPPLRARDLTLAHQVFII